MIRSDRLVERALAPQVHGELPVAERLCRSPRHATGSRRQSRTSSRKPASICSSNRAAIRAASTARSTLESRQHERGRRVLLQAGSEVEKGRPEPMVTSSARRIRRRLSGSIRAAATGIEIDEPAVQPRCRARPRASAATSGIPAREVEIVDDRLDVQPGAADQERRAASLLDVVQRRSPRRRNSATV